LHLMAKIGCFGDANALLMDKNNERVR
jgi:hypothetical protein